MSVRVVTPPTIEPVTVADAVAHCRIDHSDDNALLARLIAAARTRVERSLQRSLLPQTLRLSLYSFPAHNRPIQLPRPPVTSVDSVTYIDFAGDNLTLLSYQSDLDSEPARLSPAFEQCWPCSRWQPNGVVVTYQAGYATPAAVPPTIKLAILMLAAHWYEHRESASDEGKLSLTPQGVEFLLEGERVLRFL